MEISVEKTQNIKFNPEYDQKSETFGAISMAVVRVENYYQALLRELHRPKKDIPVATSVLAFVHSQNGVDFERSGVISVKPGDSSDKLAVEDPTIVKLNGEYFVFHSAVNPKDPGVEVAIQLVTGPNLKELGNKTVILSPKELKTVFGNVDMVKEPEFVFIDGKWLMFYEYADGIKSRIAVAESNNLAGPYLNHRLLIDGEKPWDSQHTSPGPIIITPNKDICMFYNGRGPKSELEQTPSWAIGYAIIDGKTGAVLKRSDSPILRPPEEIGPGNQLIAFANSLVSGPYKQSLYYTIADRRSAVAYLSVNF